jgi:flagellar biosynthesis chaperone FliJ
MARDPLETLMRLRRAELDEARRALGEVLEAEQAAQRERDSVEAEIVAETRVAAESDTDGDVERFARWLQRGRARLKSAELALAVAADATTLKRAELNLVRAAVEATENLLEKRRSETRGEQSRAAQQELDDMQRGKTK